MVQVWWNLSRCSGWSHCTHRRAELRKETPKRSVGKGCLRFFHKRHDTFRSMQAAPLAQALPELFKTLPNYQACFPFGSELNSSHLLHVCETAKQCCSPHIYEGISVCLGLSFGWNMTGSNSAWSCHLKNSTWSSSYANYISQEWSDSLQNNEQLKESSQSLMFAARLDSKQNFSSPSTQLERKT